MSTTDRWDELFSGRKWRIAEELTGDAPDPSVPGSVVRFDRGWFTMAAPFAYRSPLSTNLGRRGVVLVETDLTGASDLPGPRMAVGVHALRRARQRFSAIW
jgi:hypothetical protein